MSGYLIDTHVWLWLIADSSSLTAVQRGNLAHWQRVGQLYLSAISAWEAAQKMSKGRLGMEGNVKEVGGC